MAETIENLSSTEVSNYSSWGLGDDERLEDRKDWNAINDAALPILLQQNHVSYLNLKGRVSKEETGIDETKKCALSILGQEEGVDELGDQVRNLMENLTPEEHAQVQAELTQAESLAENETELNFIYQLKALVAKAYEQQGRLSEKDRLQLDKLKNEYQTSVENSSTLTQKMGKTGLVVAICFSAVFLGQFVLPANMGGLGKAMEYFSNQDKAVSGFFQQNIQAEITRESGKSSLAQTEMTGQQNKRASQDGFKQEMTEPLRLALQALKEGSQSR